MYSFMRVCDKLKKIMRYIKKDKKISTFQGYTINKRIIEIDKNLAIINYISLKRQWTLLKGGE